MLQCDSGSTCNRVGDDHLWHPNAQVDNGMRPINHEHGSVSNDFALVHWQRADGGNGCPHFPCNIAMA